MVVMAGNLLVKYAGLPSWRSQDPSVAGRGCGREKPAPTLPREKAAALRALAVKPASLYETAAFTPPASLLDQLQ